MDQQFWLDKPLVYPQHSPIPFNHDHKTVLDLGSASVTNIIVQQFEVCSHDKTGIPTCQPYYTEGVYNGSEVCSHDKTGISSCQPYHTEGMHSGSSCYNYCCQSSGFNRAVYNGPTGEAQPSMAESYNPHNIPLVNSESFTGVSNDNNPNYNLRPLKQDPIENFNHPTPSEALFNADNPYVNPDIKPVSTATDSEIYTCCMFPGPIENKWPKAELSSGYANTLPVQENQVFCNELDSNTGWPNHTLKDVQLPNLNPKDAQIPNSISHRRISPERRKPAASKSRVKRSGSLDLSRDKLLFRRPNNHDRRKSLRLLKSSNRSVSPKQSRGLVSTRKKCRSPFPQRSKDLCNDALPSRNAATADSSHENRERERLVEWRNKGQKTDPKEKVDLVEEIEKEKQVWTRSAPADLFYAPGQNFSSELKIVKGTNRLIKLCNDFEESLLKKAEIIRADLPKYEPLQRKKKISVKKHGDCHSSSSSSSSSSESEGDEDCTKEELEHKKKHPLRLHQELWFNDPGEVNDGPLCRCSAKARRSGIRHNIYAGENHLPPCDPHSNNADRLHHYRITISPATNFLVSTPTIIEHDNHEYIFEGFSMFSHKKLDELPLCKVIRFNIEYTIVYYEEAFPQNFTIRELNLFYAYLFKEILELVDLDMRAAGDPEGCPQYHFMPRFVREIQGNGKEILSMNEVLRYLLLSAKPLIPKEDLTKILDMPQYDWQRFTEDIKGMIVTYPGKKPCSLRVDQLDRDQEHSSKPQFPEIVHFGIRPPQLSYAGNPEYQKAWREYVKFRHLLANMPKPSFDDKRKLEIKENKLQSMRTKNELKRNVTVTVSSEHFHKTGIMCDVVQHGMLIPVLVSHLRFHRSLDVLEEKIKYKFNNRYLLQLALTHPSYRENFGTNPDHARNSLTNCGIRQPVYGDRKIHYQNTRKRGINTLINIMSRFGKKKETESQITHNERLEFLGDAVVEFVTSVHLFHIFSDLEEGGLATYRAAIVQNQHLAVLAKTLRLEEFMLYAHGSDLCHDLELRHAMANCFEALMGALFLDGGIEVADKVFGEALFHDSDALLDVWVNYPPHPLQEQEPLGDRKWISKFTWLQRLTEFEESIGVQFAHIRLLARAFTDRSMGYTNLTLGSNQRLEFLGDTVLQLIASEYLYKHFPEHHEGHLSLLRSSLVNNRTQAVVCNDLDMTKYAKYSNPKAELKTKDRADLLEAFLGALYVDQNLEFCQMFCNVCFFPRLEDFIMNQDWNDPKSKLQQCCLTLRTMEGGEPEIPVYKVIECMGPTNTRIYTVAVYFKNRRLAKASGHSIQQAEMNAAKKALKNSQGLFPQLDHQRRVISKSMNRQKRGGPYQRSSPSSKKGDLPSGKKKGKRNQNKEECKSRSLSPAKSKTNTKTADDVFSQKIRCRTPPLAYQSRNRSSSPELKSKKDKKCKDKGKKCKDETESEALSDKEPLLKKPRRSRSGSRSSMKSSSQSPCQKRESKSLPKGQGSRSWSRSRSMEKQSLTSSEKISSSSCCNMRKTKDVKLRSSSTTSRNKLTENKNKGSSESFEKELKTEEVAMVPSSPSVSNIEKEPSGVNPNLPDQIQKSEPGSRIENMRSTNLKRENKIVDLPKVKRTISRSRNRSPKMPGSRIENCKSTNSKRGDKNADLSKVKSTRSRSRNRSPEMPGNRIEITRSTNLARGNIILDPPKVKRTRSISRNRSLEMPASSIEITKSTNTGREDKHADSSKVKSTSCRMRNRSPEMSSIRIENIRSTNPERGGKNAALYKFESSRPRSRNRSPEMSSSRIENIKSTNPERGDKNVDSKVKSSRSKSRNRSLEMPASSIEITKSTNTGREDKHADSSKVKSTSCRMRNRSPEMSSIRIENVKSTNPERGNKNAESYEVKSTRPGSRNRSPEIPGIRIGNTRSTNTGRGDKHADLSKVKSTSCRTRNRSPEMSGSRIENIRSTNPERGGKNAALYKFESSRPRSRNRSPEMSSSRIENIKSTNPERGDKNVDSKVKSSRSKSRNRSPEMPGSRIGNTMSTNPGRGDKRADLSKVKSTRSRSRNTSPEVSGSRIENTRSTNLEKGNRNSDLHKVKSTRSRSRNRSPEMSSNRNENRRFTNPERGNKILDSSKVESTRSRSRNRSLENQSQRKCLSQRNESINEMSKSSNPVSTVGNKRGCNDFTERELTRTTRRKSRSVSRSRDQTASNRSDSHQTAKRRSRSISKGREFRTTRLTRSPPHFRNCQKLPGHSSFVPQSHIPDRPRRSCSQSNSKLTTLSRANSPQKRARSPFKRSSSPPIRVKSPQRRARSPFKRSSSPPIRVKSPQRRARSPFKRSSSPPIRVKSPQRRARSPVKRSRSPPIRVKSPQRRARSPVKRSRSPPIRVKSPQRRARSPVKRSRSPLMQAKSPPTRAFSPQSFKFRRRTPSRSPHRGRRSSPKEGIQKKMMDFMLGKRTSLDLETKNQKGASWLVNMMFDQSTPQTPKPLFSSGSEYGQTHHNPQPSNQIDTNSKQYYNQNSNCTEWQNTQSFDHQGSSNTSSYSNNTATSYPPPNYHY